MEDRNAEIYLMNGEEINCARVKAENDSLAWQSKFEEKHHTSTSLKLIKSIHYTYYNSLAPVNFNGSIQLNNDSVIEVNNAVFLKDTLSYNYVGIYEKKFSRPEGEINSLSFNDHNMGMRQYYLGGMFIFYNLRFAES